jgi:hypothetical protein
MYDDELAIKDAALAQSSAVQVSYKHSCHNCSSQVAMPADIAPMTPA